MRRKDLVLKSQQVRGKDMRFATGIRRLAHKKEGIELEEN